MRGRRLTGWLRSRLLFTFAASTAAATLLAAMTVLAEQGPNAATSPYRLALLALGAAVQLTPLTLLVAVVWVATDLGGGVLDLFEASGVPRRRIVQRLSPLLLLVLVVAAASHEVTAPWTRDVLAPSILGESKRGHPVVFVNDGQKVAVRVGETLAHLTEVWTWTTGAPRHDVDLRHRDGRWYSSSGQAVAGIPSPDRLLRSRPRLFELLAIGELLGLEASGRLLSGYPGVVVGERLLRPVFWWLWLTGLVGLLLRRRWPQWQVAAGALAWLAGGLALTLGCREQAWQLASVWSRGLVLLLPSFVAVAALCVTTGLALGPGRRTAIPQTLGAGTDDQSGR